MKREVITIKDIARQAECASSTVSKLLNGGNVREPQRSKILKIIEENGYTPNAIAKGLRTKQSYTVGVLFPEFNNFFAMNIMTMLETELSARGYSALVCSSENNMDIEKKKLRFLLDKQVDGIILIPCTKNGKHIAETVGDDVPVVLMDRLCEEYDADAVLLNNREISRQVTAMLLRQHEKVAIISAQEAHTGRMRCRGYVDAHEELNKPIRLDYIRDGGFTVDGGYLGMKDLWAQAEKPEALFVTNYEMTIGAIMAINELNIRIPEELKVVGFDYVGLAKAVNHDISVVEQPMQEMAAEAASQLFKRMNDLYTQEPQHCVMDAKIVDLEMSKV